MRWLLLVGWLMLPVVGLAWHYGPGQEKLLLDDVARILGQADAHAARGEYAAAEAAYTEALRQLPPTQTVESRRIRVERAKAALQCSKLPEAHEDMKALVEEMKDDPTADAAVLTDARTTLGSTQYYMTWLMRLEGEPREAWEPEVESARQTYRLLAEQAEARGDQKSSLKFREDLEATVRLARLELTDLQGLPLPSQ